MRRQLQAFLTNLWGEGAPPPEHFPLRNFEMARSFHPLTFSLLRSFGF